MLSKIDHGLMARTIWGECRGEPFEGQVAVGWVIQHRANKGGWWGSTIGEVCLKPYQFSCWNSNDPNRARLMTVDYTDPKFVTALGIAALVNTGNLPDFSREATHYVADYIEPPGWTKSLVQTVKIGRHQFYKEAV